MIFSVIWNWKRSVNLLEQNNTHKLMRQCHFAEWEFKLCKRFDIVWQTERAADNECDLAETRKRRTFEFFWKILRFWFWMKQQVLWTIRLRFWFSKRWMNFVYARPLFQLRAQSRHATGCRSIAPRLFQQYSLLNKPKAALNIRRTRRWDIFP